MPPKRKHSTEMPPILKRGRYSNWFEDREHQGARSVASNANAWPSLSSYSYVSNHDDDVSQYSNVTPTFPQVPHRSDHLNFTSLNIMISEGIDLFSPLRATCDVLQAVIQTIVENAENQEWAGLMKMLNFHLATVENQLVKLDEDRKIDEPTLPFDPMVKEPLQSYASKLQDIYSLTKQPGTTHNSSIFGEKLQGFDDAFFKYTRALHLFIAKTVDQVREDLSQVDPTFLKNALIESSRRFEDINVYGVQHRECHPDTRIKTLAAIRQWADDDDDSMCQVFCLLDFAGSGKSTVSKHMDREWKRDRKLMAKFFFSRDTVETMSTKRFCPTVANAFASQDETFKATLKQFQSQENCDLLPFEEQFDGLIVEPLKTINRRAILIIDALDECDNKYDQRDRLLQAISNQLPASLFLRVFLTGRPERDIKQWATTTTGVRCTSFLQLEGNHDDVERYIKQRLRDWPSTLQAKIYRVVENAESVFIWARIACDLLCKTIAQEALLRSLEKEVTLDYLYTIALEQSVPEDKYSRQVAVMVLGMILALGRPLSIAQLAQLSPSPEAIEAVVGSLGSILLYKDRNDPIRLIHATFHEYLTSATKSGPWFVQLGLGHYFLSSGCIDLLAGAVKNEQVELSNINHNIFKSAIQYSWDWWIDHCGKSNCKLGLNEQIVRFIDTGYEYLLDDSLRALSDQFIANVVSLCRRNISPYTTQTIVSRSCRWIRMRRNNMKPVLPRPKLLNLRELELRPYSRRFPESIPRGPQIMDNFETKLRQIATEMNIDLEDDGKHGGFDQLLWLARGPRMNTADHSLEQPSHRSGDEPNWITSGSRMDTTSGNRYLS